MTAPRKLFLALFLDRCFHFHASKTAASPPVLIFFRYPLPSIVCSSGQAVGYLLNKRLNGDSVKTSEARKCIKAKAKYSKLFNSLSLSGDLRNLFSHCCRLCSLEVDTDMSFGVQDIYQGLVP